MKGSNRIAASLATQDAETCLAAIHQVAPWVGLAEVCLDGMASFDLPRIIHQSPCPLIVTCRPPREGGQFAGTEAERIDILAQAVALECAYVDVEWDSLGVLLKRIDRARSCTRLIVSRHWMEDMPEQLWQYYQELRSQADIVKLVGTACSLADVLPVFDLLRRADGPLIGLAMGEMGTITRLLAPCFPNCVLTYAALKPEEATAPGQLTAHELVDLYHLDAVGAHTAIHLHLCTAGASADEVRAWNAAARPGVTLHVPVVVDMEEAASFASSLRSCLPGLTLSMDFEREHSRTR